VRLGQTTLTTQVLHDLLQLVGECFEHDNIALKTQTYKLYTTQQSVKEWPFQGKD
jgi:hypothetical protein